MTSRCGNLPSVSADARSSDNVVAFEGPFTFQRYIKPHFAHEPVALMLKDGTIGKNFTFIHKTPQTSNLIVLKINPI